ncbi:hypothetical protein AB1Y20_005892 [Prymnesium parvum]|uniref:JmjC domain-containing protein n=1 Tax=Prymnesium parvum TaxID=97485 RepID=A0AB34J142_PRYPA
MGTTRASFVWRWRRQRRAARRARTYSGARVPPSGRVAELHASSAASAAPRAFFRRFVRARRPVALRFPLAELRTLPPEWWALPPRRAARIQLDAEWREGDHARFGRGERARLSYAQLLASLRAGKTSYYLTTQQAAPADEGVLALPLPCVDAELRRRGGRGVPLAPRLAGPLVPQSVNLWLGRSAAAGTSSGLHHDYHDNLYVLLHGTKRFRLFSPADARRMYTVGRLARVHPNGRINYAGQLTSSDGLGPEEAAEAECLEARAAKRRAERKLMIAEATVEEEEEEAMEEEGGRDAESAPLRAARRRAAAAEAALRRAAGRLQRSKAQMARVRRGEGGEAEGAAAKGATPPNFSRIGALPRGAPSTWASSATGRRFPRLLRARCAEVTLEAGNMLYLPCGWFHEVTSAGDHCALNYWFHPPDTGQYKRPYRAAKFWKREWERIKRYSEHQREVGS